MVSSIALPTLRRLRPVPWLVCLATAALAVHAEPAARASKPDPLDPKASVPALNYVSSFKTDRRTNDEKPIAWREANDTVNRIGGWRAYAREAQQPEAAPTAKPPSAAPPATPPAPAQALPKPEAPALQPGHGGHKMP